MTPQERIKADAERYAGVMVWANKDQEEAPLFHEYIAATSYEAGATAEHERANKEAEQLKSRAKRLLDTLEKIVHAPVPANEREYMSWFVTAKNIAGGAISEWEAEDEVKELTIPANPCPHCGKELSRDRNLCCRECGEEATNTINEDQARMLMNPADDTEPKGMPLQPKDPFQ